MAHTCKNCSITFTGNFCSQCGQKHNVQRFTFAHIFEEAFHAFTHADKGFIILIKKLMLNPGKVAYEYIVEGKRKKYFNLFTFFVLITAVSTFVESKDLDIKETVFKENNEYGYILNYYSKALLLVIIPLVAFFAWVINYKKPALKFSEYTVFAMILISATSIINIAAKAVNYFITGVFKKYGSVDENLWYPIFLIVFIAYANYVFHTKMKKQSVVKSVLTGTSFCLLQMAIVIFVVWAVIRGFNSLGFLTMYGITISRH